MNNLLARVLTGVIAGGFSVAIIALSPWGLYVFCAVVSLVGLAEFYRMSGIGRTKAAFGGVALGVLVWAYLILYFFKLSTPVLSFMMFVEMNWALILAGGLTLVSSMILSDKEEKHALRTMALTTMGIFYAFLPIVALFLLSHSPFSRTELGAVNAAESYNAIIPLGVLFLTWALDVMAYFGGRLFGKHPLFSRISPKKTIEGSIIGILFTVAGGFALEYIWPTHWNWVIVAGIIAVGSQVGDLVESMYKRSLDMKDSSGILPGHGGMLDRFDGMYLTLPILYLYQFGVFMMAY